MQCLSGDNIFLYHRPHTYINLFLNLSCSGGLYERRESLPLPTKSHFYHQDKAAAV